MGGEGLRAATEVAILNANYVAAPARAALPGALHRARRAWSRTSASSTCARSPQRTGVTVDDVAKRLIDYGFHAPTMSFPVAGTLMVEPTESEDLGELDRFCDAMIAIRDEIRADRGRGVGASTTARCATRRTPRPTSSSSELGPRRTPASRPRSRAAVERSGPTSTGRR